MAFIMKADQNWTADQKKKMQQYLNKYGFTDANGNQLTEDGIIGPKTNEAIGKMNRYQQELENPSGDTKQLQKQINNLGYTDQSGERLKVDGVYGPKTEAANINFENNFLAGLSDGQNQSKAVQKTEFPKMPQLTEDRIRSLVKPYIKESELVSKPISWEAKINPDLDELYHELAKTLNHSDYSGLPGSTRKVLLSIKNLIKKDQKRQNLNNISELNQNELNKYFANNIPKSQNMLYNNTNKYKNSNITSLNNSLTIAPVNDTIKNTSQKNNGTQSATSVNTGKIENDIWRQAANKGYFDGTWYEDDEKVLTCAEILLDDVKKNGGLNLQELQKDKVKRELFEVILTNKPGKDNLVFEDLGDLEAIANLNNLGEINPFNITPEQLEALIERYKRIPKLSEGQKSAAITGNIVLDILLNGGIEAIINGLIAG